MVPLREIDVRLVLSRLPDDVRALLETNRLYLAGGFVRATLSATKPSDIDLFGSGGIEVMEPIAKTLTGRSLIKTDRALTLIGAALPVQFVTGFTFESPYQLLDRFDYTVAQAAIWRDGEQWKSLASPDFYADLAARRLVYAGNNAIEDVGGSILRLRKFLSAGYSIRAASLARLCARFAFVVTQIAEAGISEDRVQTVMEAKLRELDPSAVGLEVA
jgi:hypothetical protein